MSQYESRQEELPGPPQGADPQPAPEPGLAGPPPVPNKGRGGGNKGGGRVGMIIGSILIVLVLVVGAGGLGYYLGRQSKSLERIERATRPGVGQGQRDGQAGPPGQDGRQAPQGRSDGQGDGRSALPGQQGKERVQNFLRSKDTEVLKGEVKSLKDGGLVLETPRGEVEVQVEDTVMVSSQSGPGQLGDIKEEDTVMVFSKGGEGEEVTAVAVWIIPTEAK